MRAVSWSRKFQWVFVVVNLTQFITDSGILHLIDPIKYDVLDRFVFTIISVIITFSLMTLEAIYYYQIMMQFALFFK